MNQQEFQMQLQTLKPEFQNRYTILMSEYLTKDYEGELPKGINALRNFACAFINENQMSCSASTFLKLLFEPNIEVYKMNEILALIRACDAPSFNWNNYFQMNFDRTKDVKEQLQTLGNQFAQMRIEIEKLTQTINPLIEQESERLLRKCHGEQKHNIKVITPKIIELT